MACRTRITKAVFVSRTPVSTSVLQHQWMTTSMTYARLRSSWFRVAKTWSAARYFSDSKRDGDSVNAAPSEDGDSISSSTLPRRVLKRINTRLPSQKVAWVPIRGSPEGDRSRVLQRLAPSEHALKELVQDATSASDTKEPPEFPSDAEKYQAWYRDQSRKAKRPSVDPRTTSIVLFPGQGSQFVGMGQQLLEYVGVSEMYETASGILGYDLLNICLNGPKAKLDQTVYCQPAIFVTSLAAVEKLRALYPEALASCVGTSGFSVGEFASLVLTGAMSFQDALLVVKVRAEAMQAASEANPSGMMTAFCGPETRLKFGLRAAREFCRVKLNMERPVCTIANYLYPECKVIAGHAQALDFVEQHRMDFGIRRLKRLPVSGAFHTELMAPAKAALTRALQDTSLAPPCIPMFSNVSASAHSHPPTLRRLLASQLTKPVRWEQIMHALMSRPQGQEFPSTFEVGPGRQLGAILKLVNAKAFESYRSIDV